MGDFRKLEIWKRACALSDAVDELVDILPKRAQKLYGDQMSRAAFSVQLNIEEGSGFNSDPMFAKHVDSAIASANEVEGALGKLERRKLLPPKYAQLLEDAPILRKKLGAFLKKLR
jgi:four helix bundle protein